MIDLNNNQMQELLNNKVLHKGGVNDLLKMTLNAIMHGERQAYLQEQNDSNNKANGYRPIKVNGYGRQLALSIPRDRLGAFKPVLMLALKEQEQEVHQLCYELYREGLTTRKISKIFEKIYGKKYAQPTISSMTQTFKEELEAWRSRPLDNRYLVVYLDAIHTKVRREDKVEGEAFYIALGVKEDYSREIIGIYNNPTESAAGWQEILKDMRRRGLQKIDLVVADGIIGLEEKVLIHYPKAAFQKCVTHLKRNIINKVRPQEKPAMAADLDLLFDISDNRYTKEEAYQRSREVVLKWKKKYPFIKNVLSEENLRPHLTCLDFNFKIRTMIYTTNVLERLNKEFRTALKIRNAMPSIDSVLLLLSAVACEIEKTTYARPIYSFSNEPSFQGNFINL